MSENEVSHMPEIDDAMRQYLKDQKWERLVDRAEKRNIANGLTEADVPRAVAEYRSEKRRGETTGQLEP